MILTLERRFLSECRREDIKDERGYDLLVFRADDTGRIIAGFPYSRFKSAGGSVFESALSAPGAREYFNEMLAGYSRVPYLCGAAGECAVIVRGMAAETNLCAALLLSVPLSAVNRLAGEGELDMVVLNPSLGRTGSAKEEGLSAAVIRRAYRILCDAFYTGGAGDADVSGTVLFTGTTGLYGTPLASGAGGSVGVSDLIKRGTGVVCALARLAACGCVCRTEEGLERCFGGGMRRRKFNWDIFRAFTLLSLLFCGRCGIRREAELSFVSRGGELVVEIECETGAEAWPSPELDECRRLADRRRLYFECSTHRSAGLRLTLIRFSPVVYDWSVLGVKGGINSGFSDIGT